MTNYLRSIDSEDWSILTVAAGATFLFVALTLEYVFNQLPCALCLNQRMWMILATLLAAGGLAHNPRLVSVTDIEYCRHRICAATNLLADYAIRSIFMWTRAGLPRVQSISRCRYFESPHHGHWRLRRTFRYPDSSFSGVRAVRRRGNHAMAKLILNPD